MATGEVTQEKTGLGNYFVANYPPFSFWKPSHLPDACLALQKPPRPGVPLGLYLHIPFCRKRCKFCYFRVYTDKNARDVEGYVQALAKEIELYSRLPIVDNRRLHFVYFGGGTPSYLSVSQLRDLFDRVKRAIPLADAEEVTFECEPGTLQQPKVAALKKLGVTRLSLGIENFNDRILEANGRAHLSQEIHRAYQWIQDARFDQVNIDLIAGMVGESWDNWRECIRQTVKLSPDSVTIYQMELPFNTVFSKELLQVDHDQPTETVADWPTKRAWVDFAFDELSKAGYSVSSAYTMVKDPVRCRFVYRDSLWHGADMFGTGVASFGHVNGVHVQNVDGWEPYLALIEKGELPLGRALPVEPRHMMIRELILQLKTGRVEMDYFQKKFGVEVRKEFEPCFDHLVNNGYLSFQNGRAELTRSGLMQVDRLLPNFFDAEHRVARYT
jgi:oxygen-independent coproporphyrinogen-3 oxidase